MRKPLDTYWRCALILLCGTLVYVVLVLQEMKKVLWAAIAYQLYLVTRAVGAGSESLLAARAIGMGEVPYRDFMLHVGPLPAYLFAALWAIPKEAWPSLIFIGFNLLTTWGLFLLARRYMAATPSYAVCAIFLLVAPLYGANEMYPEVMVTTFGIWGIYFIESERRWAAWMMFLFGMLTKQTALVFPLAVGFGSLLSRSSIRMVNSQNG